MIAEPLTQREIDEWYDDSQLTHTEITLEEERRLWATIIQLREDASDLVEAGDTLGSFAMKMGVDGLLATQEWRNCKARDRNRRWKRDIH